MGNTIEFHTFTELAQAIALVRDSVIDFQVARLKAEQVMSEREYLNMLGVEYSTLGKNEGERAIAKERLLRDDEVWFAAHNEAQMYKVNLAIAEGTLNRYLDIRRGMEWDVRARLVAQSNNASDAPIGSDAELDDLPFAEVLGE